MEPKEPSPLQAQLWAPGIKRYVPMLGVPTSDPNIVQREAHRRGARAWRICRTDRKVDNPRIGAPRHSGYDRSVETVQRQYLTWAALKGLESVTAFSNRPPCNYVEKKGAHDYWRKGRKYYAPESTPIFSGEIRYVDADRYFEVKEDCEDDWLAVA